VESFSHAGGCARASLLTSRVPSCAPILTSCVSSRAPLLAPRHANGLSLGIRTRQSDRGCGDGKGSDFSEKRKSPSAGNRFQFDEFIHGQVSTEAG
jgi:hypothetical protein